MRSAILTCLVTLAAFGARAALPRKVYDDARKTAALHLQVKVINVARPKEALGQCTVEGEVATIFRDELAKTRKNSPIGFSISCKSGGGFPPPGGAIWTDAEALAKAKYLEVYLNREGDGYKVAYWQSKIIDAPTMKPKFPVSQ